MKQLLILAALVPTIVSGPASLAQEGLATTSTIRGRNTIQQAPSGGSVSGGARLPTLDANDGRPTPQDRLQERQDAAASQICKGC